MKALIRSTQSRFAFVLLAGTLTVGCSCPAPVVHSATFGTADGCGTGPDPTPYNPALPEFISYLTTQGISPNVLTSFDDPTIDLHMVATLRHGLRQYFAGGCHLDLCFAACGHSSLPDNDTVTIYNTVLPSSFTAIYNSRLVPTLVNSWTDGSTGTMCIDLTAQMTASQIDDMLQFRLQDDTEVDYITMTVTC